MRLGTIIQNEITLYSQNLLRYVEDSSKKIFDLLRTLPRGEIQTIQTKQMQIGKFYLVLYNFNGNQLWVPLLTIDFRVIKNKNIVYILNPEYLPYKYRISYFDLLFDTFRQIVDFNEDQHDVLKEKRFNFNFDQIYNSLKKNGGFNYAISALNLEKIKQVYTVSTTLAHRFVMIDTKPWNGIRMKELYEKIPPSEERDNLQFILQQFRELLQEYEEDSKEYYKKLKAFERLLELYED
jgi:hypothetical protein